MYVVGLFVIACILPGVPAPGRTKLCRHCPHPVLHPSECMEFHKCPEACITDVHLMNGQYMFTYSCHPEHECHAGPGPMPGPGPHHDHQHGQHVCRECCHDANCDRFNCANFLPTPPPPTPAPTTPAPTPSPTTTTTTKRTTTTPTTTTQNEPSATTKHLTQPTEPASTQSCKDMVSSPLTCDDMKYFGYCDPAAGSGYALAQIRCQATCGFCH